MAALEIDVKRVTRYPPEIFLQAKPFNLAMGVNKIAEYVGFRPPYIIATHGISFARRDDLIFHLDVDGFTDVVRLENLGAIKGLDYEEEVKIPATRSMTMRITAPTAIADYQLRHKTLVTKPNTVLRKVLDMPLTNQDRKLDQKYAIEEILAKERPKPFDPYQGVERVYPISSVLTASGVLFRFNVPDGYKAILLDLAAHRPTAAAQAYINITRDDDLVLPELDL